MRYWNKQINVLLNNFVRFISFFFTCKNFEGLRQLLATEKLFKNDEKCFLFPFSRYYCLDVLVMYPKRLDKINFKFYDLTAWLTNNCNTHIAQYLDKQTQSDNEI